MNSILCQNMPMDMVVDPESKPRIHYNSIEKKAVPTALENSNLNVDPLFVKLEKLSNLERVYLKININYNISPLRVGDYHLESRVARWDQDHLQWTKDGVTSPCIDKGYPGTPIGVEPEPNGGIINLGAYGDTLQASSGE